MAHITRIRPEKRGREPSLQYGEATIFGYVLRKSELLLGMAVEVEWAMGKAGVKVLQVLPPQTVDAIDDLWLRHSKFSVPKFSVRPTDIDAGCSDVKSHRASLASEAFPWSSAGRKQPSRSLTGHEGRSTALPV